MPKLNVESKAYPWIIMGLGALVFTVAAITVIIFYRLMPPNILSGVMTVTSYLEIQVGLILMDIIFNNGKYLNRMVKLGFTIAGVTLLVLISSVPLMFVFNRIPLIGTFMFEYYLVTLIIVQTFISGFFYIIFILRRRIDLKLTMTGVLASLPGAVLLYFMSVMMAQTRVDEDIEMLRLLSMGGMVVKAVSIGMGISLIKGLAAQKEALKARNIPLNQG